MKKLFPVLVLLVLSVLASCKKDNNELSAVSLSAGITLDEALSSYSFNFAETEVSLTNLTSGTVVKAKADANGRVTFPSIAPGNYDVKATLVIKAADYTNITGTYVQDDVTLNGSLSNQLINGTNGDLSLKLKAGIIGNWVFKQIYYAGSHTTNGASFRDQFFEIYNNSNELLYADSLYFGQAEGNASRLSAIDRSLSYLLPSGQFDWSKSIGMTGTNVNENFIYANSLFMIPGNGKTYPVQPGKSIIVAATAINHKAPFTNTAGKEVSVKDPSLTVDLSKADFEVWLGDFVGNTTPLATDVDNPAVTNVKTISRGGNKDLILDATGRDGYFLFKRTEPISTLKSFPSPNQTTVTNDTELFYQIPVSILLDAVQILVPTESSRIPLKFGDALDAGPTFVSKGQYSSQSLIRKTAKTVNGRVVLKDTNNSAADFTELNIPDVTKTAFK